MSLFAELGSLMEDEDSPIAQPLGRSEESGERRKMHASHPSSELSKYSPTLSESDLEPRGEYVSHRASISPLPEEKSKGWTKVERKKRKPLPLPVKIYTEEEAYEIERKINISLLATTLNSKRAVMLQQKGYRFDGIYTPGQHRQPPKSSRRWDIQFVDVHNKWDDKAVFKKYKP